MTVPSQLTRSLRRHGRAGVFPTTAWWAVALCVLAAAAAAADEVGSAQIPCSTGGCMCIPRYTIVEEASTCQKATTEDASYCIVSDSCPQERRKSMLDSGSGMNMLSEAACTDEPDAAARAKCLSQDVGFGIDSSAWIDVFDKYGFRPLGLTALAAAIQRRYQAKGGLAQGEASVMALLAAGADPNVVTYQVVPVFCDFPRLRLDNAATRYINRLRSPLHDVVRSASLTRALLAHGANPFAEDSSGLTPFEFWMNHASTADMTELSIMTIGPYDYPLSFPCPSPFIVYISLQPWCEYFADQPQPQRQQRSPPTTGDDNGDAGGGGGLATSKQSGASAVSPAALVSDDAAERARIEERADFESWAFPIRRLTWGSQDFFAKQIERLVHPATLNGLCFLLANMLEEASQVRGGGGGISPITFPESYPDLPPFAQPWLQASKGLFCGAARLCQASGFRGYAAAYDADDEDLSTWKGAQIYEERVRDTCGKVVVGSDAGADAEWYAPYPSEQGNYAEEYNVRIAVLRDDVGRVRRHASAATSRFHFHGATAMHWASFCPAFTFRRSDIPKLKEQFIPASFVFSPSYDLYPPFASIDSALFEDGFKYEYRLPQRNCHDMVAHLLDLGYPLLARDRFSRTAGDYVLSMDSKAHTYDHTNHMRGLSDAGREPRNFFRGTAMLFSRGADFRYSAVAEDAERQQWEARYVLRRSVAEGTESAESAATGTVAMQGCRGQGKVLYRWRGQCLSFCPAGTFFETSNGDERICTVCHPACLTCSSRATSCTSCADGVLVPAFGGCFDRPPLGEFPVLSNPAAEGEQFEGVDARAVSTVDGAVPPRNVLISQPCHRFCVQGCSGPTAADCLGWEQPASAGRRCADSFALIVASSLAPDVAGAGECVATCPLGSFGAVAPPDSGMDAACQPCAPIEFCSQTECKTAERDDNLLCRACEGNRIVVEGSKCLPCEDDSVKVNEFKCAVCEGVPHCAPPPHVQCSSNGTATCDLCEDGYQLYQRQPFCRECPDGFEWHPESRECRFSATAAANLAASSDSTKVIGGVVGGLFALVLVATASLFALHRARPQHPIFKSMRSRLHLLSPSDTDAQMVELATDPFTSDMYNLAQGLRYLTSKLSKEVEREQIVMVRRVAGGAFGEVAHALWKVPGERPIDVAVKTLVRDDESEKKQFLKEAALQARLKHPNVLGLLGMVSKDEPIMLITDFLYHGALKDYLLSSKGTLPLDQLMFVARDIMAGMCYLDEEQGYVHRDLAARNVLVGHRNICKISDFGMCVRVREVREPVERQGSKLAPAGVDGSGGEEVLIDTVYVGEASEKLPVRWCSPEVLKTRTFSVRSDVWAFGCTLGEIFSWGKTPFDHIKSNRSLMASIKTGSAVPGVPNATPRIVAALMKGCFAHEPKARPLFSRMLATIDELDLTVAILDLVFSDGDGAGEGGVEEGADATGYVGDVAADSTGERSAESALRKKTIGNLHTLRFHKKAGALARRASAGLHAGRSENGRGGGGGDDGADEGRAILKNAAAPYYCSDGDEEALEGEGEGSVAAYYLEGEEEPVPN